MYGIPRDPTFVSLAIVLCRNVDEIFAEYHEHLVPRDVSSVSASRLWNTTYDYIQWFYRVSCPYMTPASDGGPRRSSHQEIP